MSNMLDQAIVDAQALREAAIKSAEKAVVEKYAPEVKQAIQQLLEQDPGEEEMGLDPLAGEEEELISDSSDHSAFVFEDAGPPGISRKVVIFILD